MDDEQVSFSYNIEGNELMRDLLAVLLDRRPEEVGQFVIVAMTDNGDRCDSPSCGGFHRIQVISTAHSSFVAVDILDNGILAIEAAPIITGSNDAT